MKNVNSTGTVLIDSQRGLSCKAEPAISGLAAFQLLSDPWGLPRERYLNLQPGEGKGHSLSLPIRRLPVEKCSVKSTPNPE